jgi:two-component system, cell cycle response regulator DivK
MSQEPRRGRPPLVLVVEDNPVNLELVTALLEERGCEVLGAMTGDAALQLLRESHPDLVLVDVQLPGMSGYQVTRRIKADPALAGIPVVALTAHAMVNEDQRAREAGCDAFLTKPIDMRVFTETLQRLLFTGP